MKGMVTSTLGMALLLGLTCFFATRALRDGAMMRNVAHTMDRQMRNTEENLAWMRQKLALSDEEFRRECALHEDYVPECHRLAAEMAVARTRLKEALQQGGSEAEQEAIRDFELRFEACERAAIKHAKKAAAAMNPKAGTDYLTLMLPRLFPDQIPALHAATPAVP